MASSDCIQVIASLISEPIRVSSYRLDGKLDVSAQTICMDVDVTASRLGSRLVVRCGLVCSVNKDVFLNVAPTVLWISPDMLASAEFEIKSNTSWFIN